MTQKKNDRVVILDKLMCSEVMILRGFWATWGVDKAILFQKYITRIDFSVRTSIFKQK